MILWLILILYLLAIPLSVGVLAILAPLLVLGLRFCFTKLSDYLVLMSRFIVKQDGGKKCKKNISEFNNTPNGRNYKVSRINQMIDEILLFWKY